MCGGCHFRDGEHRIATSGGLIRHHEQFDELINSPHRFMDCVTCQDPHKSVVYDLGGRLDEPIGTSYHGSAEVKLASMADHDCETCHMPFAVDDDTGALGDIHSPIFKINTDPNPCNPITHVRYDLPKQEHVRIEIRDVRGALVYTLADEYQSAGRYLATWDGIDNDGASVASDTYFMHVSSDAFRGTVKMTLLR